MNFKDLHYSLGKIKTDVWSQLARKNPLQSPDSKPLSLWIFEERNDLAAMRTAAYHHGETGQAFRQYIQSEVDSPQAGGDVADLEDIGDKLFLLLYKQTEVERDYAARYQRYRQVIKSIRDRDDKQLSDLRQKKNAVQDRLRHMEKTHRGSSRQVEQLTEELDQLTRDVQERQREMDDYKRFALREAFYVRFNAMYEYGQKMALLAGFGKYLVDLLDIEPTPPGQARAEYTKARDADRIWMDCLLAIDGWSAELDERPTVLERFLDDDDEEDAAPLSEADVAYGNEQYQQETQKEQPQHQGVTQLEGATEVTEVSTAEGEVEEARCEGGLTRSDGDASGEWKYYAAIPEKQEPPAYSEIHSEAPSTADAAQDQPASSHDEKESLQSYYDLYKRYEQEEQTHPCRPYREFRRQTIHRNQK